MDVTLGANPVLCEHALSPKVTAAMDTATKSDRLTKNCFPILV